MRLTEASVAIRPRTAWEAIDLGVLLARRHAGLLMASWALLTLPLFALLCAVLWQYPAWALFIFWWLKPAYERLPLYILSQALFGNTPSLRQSLRALPRLLWPQLLASLTWRRLSPTRSFDLPVLQLEGLSGQARSQRLVVLGQRDSAAATWLTLVGVHLEIALWMGLAALFYLMLPQQVEMSWSWETLVAASSGQWLWLEHLSNLLYVLLLIIWEPVYVACGFTLYLNRRTALEAWDIELTFRRLRQRLTGSAYALMLGCALLLTQLPNQAWAEQQASASEQSEEQGPEAPRLLKQSLTSQAARASIESLLDEPPFQHRETVTRWRLGEENGRGAGCARAARSSRQTVQAQRMVEKPGRARPGIRSTAVGQPRRAAGIHPVALPGMVADLWRGAGPAETAQSIAPRPAVRPGTGPGEPAR